jgi:hypothetical protein
MLYEIDSPPTPDNSLILLHPADSVAIARVPIPAGQALQINGNAVTARAGIPAGHKIAIRALQPGDPVYRFGNVIGFATTHVSTGDHVHVHNLGYEERNANEIRPETVPPRATRTATSTFLGYPRPDGRAGTRQQLRCLYFGADRTKLRR